MVKKGVTNFSALKLLLAIVLLGLCACAGQIDHKQYDLDSPPKELVWCGVSRESVLLLTEKDSLYRSEDKGFTWKKMNDIMTNTGKDQLEENENEVLEFDI
jgi:hypothetical protein